MRNLHLHIYKEFGMESGILLQKWEGLVRKEAGFVNHKRFTLRCLGAGITPVNV